MSEHKIPLYQKLAVVVDARLRCLDGKGPANHRWKVKHEETIRSLVAEHMPSGSGIDRGTEFDFDESTGERLVFFAAFHHMNEGGFYDGWTDHVITVTPSLMSGTKIKVSGKNRNDVKSLLHELFDVALDTVVD